MAHVLVVDDEPGIRSFLADSLTTEGHVVDQCPDGTTAIRKLREHAYDVVLTDLRMPGADGLAVVQQAREAHPETAVVVITAYGSVLSAVEAMKLGAFDYLEKPVGGPADVRRVVARAVERGRAHTPPAPVGELALTYGAPAMEPVVHALQRVAVTDASVLLLGESGTGKEVAARAVHRWSRRATGPFAAVNCAALSESLLESELFGHEKGAFTGAAVRHRGRIELAEGGTFLLDEVGELALTLQAKLLRVLQERVFERVGGGAPVPCNVRWIAATNRDLGAMMRAGSFREDLYHRLAVFPVRLPPLRERRTDIVPLAERLLAGIAAALGRPLGMSPTARTALAAGEWPGNVRELANALERAAILTEGDVVTAEHLGSLPSGGGAGTAGASSTMEQAEREAIRRALAECGGNRRRAAAQLGIGLRTLYEKLKRYELG